MTWILYIVTGLSVPNLQQIAVYTDEQICIKATKQLENQRVRSVCIPKEKSA
jgi:hypothetical protein